jgi:hypothetical protein
MSLLRQLCSGLFRAFETRLIYTDVVLEETCCNLGLCSLQLQLAWRAQMMRRLRVPPTTRQGQGTGAQDMR